jgi:glycosyltransferase involved in cell wall biosynthesis
VPDVLLVVSATFGNGQSASPAPRKDYAVLASALNATVLDYSWVKRSLVARTIARLLGVPAAQAWLAFRQRRTFGAIVTDGEHIGIPLALLLKLAGAAVPHVTIGHRISSAKKRALFRWLKLHTHITRVAVHAMRQYEVGVHELGIPADRLALVPYQVDTRFWCPQPVAEERQICSAGLEHRDYQTLFRAVDGLDARVVIGAASHWSRRRNTAAGTELPPNVNVGAFDYHALRELYARSAVVAVPLDDVDFQAGITTILEAMAMGKVVVVTHTQGQTDVVEDRRTVTRGNPPRVRAVSLLRMLADSAGVEIEPTGFYVPPGDSAALRRALVYLLDHPAERARLGAAGRRAVERLMSLDQFVERMQEVVDQARSGPCPARLAAAGVPVSPGAS